MNDNYSNTPSEAGFTIIELLVAIAIVGVLAAISIPQYAVYRDRGFNATAVSDLRNGLTAQEAYYVDNDEYASCSNVSSCESVLPEFESSRDGDAAPVLQSLEFTSAADGQTYTALARHRSGSIEFNFDSATGAWSEN